MKQLVKPSNITFSGAVVSMAGVDVPLSQILLVANATTGVVHYSISGPAPSAYTQGSTSQITLASAPSVGDKLTIYYDDALPNSATAASVTSFSSINASALIKAANPNRKSIVLANNPNGSLVYVLFGSGVTSSSNYSLALQPSDTATISGVTLALQGFSTGAGNLLVTELT
jgi:hypothetical protein